MIGLKEGFKFNLLVVGPFGLKRDEKDKIVFLYRKRCFPMGGRVRTNYSNK